MVRTKREIKHRRKDVGAVKDHIRTRCAERGVLSGEKKERRAKETALDAAGALSSHEREEARAPVIGRGGRLEGGGAEGDGCADSCCRTERRETRRWRTKSGLLEANGWQGVVDAGVVSPCPRRFAAPYGAATHPGK